MRRSILITGAGSGIGKDTAFALARKGHEVYATTETQTQRDQLQNEVDQKGLNISVFKLDITDPLDREKIKELNLDVLINNAAIGESGSLADIPMDRVRKNFETNVFCTFELSQIALEKMLKKDKGTVIFISSLAGKITMPFLGSYCMTKFALSSGVDALRSEMRRITRKVHITLVEPGGYHTGFNQRNISTKFEWMDENSPFYPILEKIQKEDARNFRFTEVRSTNSIVNKIVKAAEASRPRFRYTAPWWQAFGVQVMRIFGK